MVEEVLNVNVWAGLMVNFIIVDWINLNSKLKVNRGQKSKSPGKNVYKRASKGQNPLVDDQKCLLDCF